MAHLTDTGVSGPLTFDSFGCGRPQASPATPDNIAALVPLGQFRTLTRKMSGNGAVTMPDGQTVEFWTFEDPINGIGPTVPAPLIRVNQGEVIHGTLETRLGTHTIHWHGIEPTSLNDGVPHTGMEVQGSYTYQWQANHPGTYFYHCHKNTVLHFEMGMHGMLIIDPPTPVGGRKRVFEGGPEYDVEALWSFDDVDPTFRMLGVDAGLCGEDAGLNNFNPQYFMITGVPNSNTPRDPRVAINAVPGQNVLVRALNASYSVIQLSFSGISGKIVEIDGRPLGGPIVASNPRPEPWSAPYMLPAGQILEITTAQRYSILFENVPQGFFTATANFLHVTTRRTQARGRGRAITRFVVSTSSGGGTRTR